MDLPALEIAPREPIFQAAGRLEEECRAKGIRLASFETLNTSLPISMFCNFFQAWIDGIETICVIMTEEWSKNDALAAIVSILLDIRSDPDPPGADLKF